MVKCLWEATVKVWVSLTSNFEFKASDQEPLIDEVISLLVSPPILPTSSSSIPTEAVTELVIETENPAVLVTV